MPWPRALRHISAWIRAASSGQWRQLATGPAGLPHPWRTGSWRTWPSEVSRARSQAAQKGADTLAMIPTWAGPPSTRNSSAGALRGSLSGNGVRVEPHGQLLVDLLGRHHLVALPRVLSVPEAICSMNRSW